MTNQQTKHRNIGRSRPTFVCLPFPALPRSLASRLTPCRRSQADRSCHDSKKLTEALFFLCPTFPLIRKRGNCLSCRDWMLILCTIVFFLQNYFQDACRQHRPGRSRDLLHYCQAPKLGSAGGRCRRRVLHRLRRRGGPHWSVHRPQDLGRSRTEERQCIDERRAVTPGCWGGWREGLATTSVVLNVPMI